MNEYTATVRWQRDGAKFADNRYARDHEWQFDGGTSVPASASPAHVPSGCARADAVDPEEAFVASLSSCHMLWFLSIAAKRGFVVESYADHAVGVMEKNENGKLAITRVTLNPNVQFAERTPTREEHEVLHHRAHEECFLANSVKTVVEVVLN
ncbi:MAG TPA: OsmC family protein [Thermoanaerobaculia bacterium]|nr:OsmC family protein [Thermoanaerobaculia bacterium]